MTDAADSWLKFLNPDVLKSNLTRASVFLTCWELLKDTIIDLPLSFFASEWREGRWLQSSEYKNAVLSLDGDRLTASAMWFRAQGALTEDDLVILRAVRDHRNTIAHELPKIVLTTGSEVSSELSKCLLALTIKIDSWWFREIEVATRPELSHLTEDQIAAAASMRVFVMQLLQALADGDDAQLRSIYQSFRAEIQNKA